MLLHIAHTTRYTFASPPHYGLQQVRLSPPMRRGQMVRDWALDIQGGRAEVSFVDQHDNRVTLASVSTGSFEVVVRCAGHVETQDCAGVVGAHHGPAPLWYYARPTAATEPGAQIEVLVSKVSREEGGDVARMHALSARILERAPYRKGETDAGTSAEQALAIGSGVCQDHTHIFIAAARALGFPARYVSGYLLMQEQPEQEAGHAWAEVHIDGLGWVGFDISNQICPDDRYVAVAIGLDANEAAPLRGLLQVAGEGTLDVSVEIQQQ